MTKERKTIIAYLKERKTIIAYLIVIMILFGGGVGLGYYIWELNKQKKPDYKKYLSKTINYINKIEKNNRGFIKQVKQLKADVAILKKNMNDAKIQFNAQSKSLQVKTASLEKEKAQLQSSIGESQKIAKEKEELQRKINSLLDKNQKLSTEKKELQGKIDSLFGYNQDLVKEKRQLLKKIDQLTSKPDIDIKSPVSEEKIPVEEKGQRENE